MGCSSSTGASAAGVEYTAPGVGGARADPEPREVRLPDRSVLKVGLATDSLAYSLLAAHGDGALFIDARPREAFNRAHILSAWWLEHLVQPPPAPQQKQAGQAQSSAARFLNGHSTASNHSGSTAASSGQPPPTQPRTHEAEEVAWEAAVRQRCNLRTVVIYGAGSGSLQDPAVLHVLQELKRLAVRPKGQLLVLRGGMEAFAKRFAMCVRRQGGEKSQPQPPCPAEILPPGLGVGRRPPALYLGTERCVHEQGTDKVLAALGVRSIINLSGQPCKPPKKLGSIINVQLVPGGGDALVATAKDACEKALRQSSPCLLYGPTAALAAALVMAEVLPSIARTGDEVDAWVRARFPAAPVLDAASRAALVAATAKNRPKDAKGAPPPPEPVAALEPVAPPAGSGAAGAGGDAAAQAGSLPAAQGPTYVEELSSKLRRQRGGEAALNTVRAALTHILEHPTEPKYRRLRGSNERVKKEVLSHKEAVLLLRMSGFIHNGEDLELPPAAPLQALRDLLALLPTAKGR